MPTPAIAATWEQQNSSHPGVMYLVHYGGDSLAYSSMRYKTTGGDGFVNRGSPSGCYTSSFSITSVIQFPLRDSQTQATITWFTGGYEYLWLQIYISQARKNLEV